MFFDNSINFKSVQILVLCVIRWHLLHLQEVHLRMRLLRSSRFPYTSEKWENRLKWLGGREVNYAYYNISNGRQDQGCVDQKTQRNDLLMEMHSYSQKCQSDQQRQEADAYQCLWFFFPSFLFTWTCTYVVQILLLYFLILQIRGYIVCHSFSRDVMVCYLYTKLVNSKV